MTEPTEAGENPTPTIASDVTKEALANDLVSKPQCQPIGLAFPPSLPPDGGVVTGLVTIGTTATSDCTVQVTSTNSQIFMPQQQVVVRKNYTTATVSAIYTPPATAGGPGETAAASIPVYVWASSTTGASYPAKIVMPGGVHGNLVADCSLDKLTFPTVVAHQTQVDGTVYLLSRQTADCVVYFTSSSPYFIPPTSVTVPAGQLSAPVLVTIIPQATKFTASVLAFNDSSALDPVEVDVPAS